MIELKEYQKEAVRNLVIKINNIVKSPESGVCVFQSPTGSGKTLMVSQALKELVKKRKDDKKFSFIWISVRMLHEQSKEKLERYYEDDQTLQCSYFEDLIDKKINENEILFINWHSINKKDINIYVRENEQENNLNSIIQNTKDEGRAIILIIDESHHTASSEKSRELIEIISPKVTLEVSATPHMKENVSEIEKVYLSDVKAEEMIKSEIAVNPEFLEIKVGPKSADELVIGQALKKREESAEMYKKEGANINPLVLLQLPDKKGDMTDKKELVERILKDKFNITEENGKLAVWLSEDKSDTLINIEKNDNEVEVLIFKQAIALGWDCPRASILVIFRESKSFVFTIQTIGRIMRMPKLRYYLKESELNKGFVFTNLQNIEITEDYAKDYITVYEAKRNNELYDEVSLASIYLKRQRERTRLSGEFIKIFLDVAQERKLKEKINTNPTKIVSPIIANGKIVDVDKKGEIEHKGKVDIALSDHEVQRAFDYFITQNCSPYAPVDSSDRMKSAIYQVFYDDFKLKKFDPKVQRIVLGKENVQILVDTLNQAKDKYLIEVVKEIGEKREKVEVPKWEVPIVINYNSLFSKSSHPKSIMQPLYARKPSKPEIEFMERLDKSSKVKWWFKNGEGEIKYFAVLYRENGTESAFYVDFVVMFKDGAIGLFDTKSGITAKEAKYKAEGLRKYLSKQKSKGRNLWGGIVIQTDRTWRYNDQADYKYDQKNLSNWKILEI
jgi:type III restriction enzyme